MVFFTGLSHGIMAYLILSIHVLPHHSFPHHSVAISWKERLLDWIPCHLLSSIRYLRRHCDHLKPPIVVLHDLSAGAKLQVNPTTLDRFIQRVFLQICQLRVPWIEHFNWVQRSLQLLVYLPLGFIIELGSLGSQIINWCCWTLIRVKVGENHAIKKTAQDRRIFAQSVYST